MIHSERDSLEEFLINYHTAPALEGEISKKYFEEGVVEIEYLNGLHSCNGLLITSDGYFLTCGHCVECGIGDKRIRLSNGQKFPIDRVCTIDITHDIALCKARIGQEEGIRHYKYLFYLDCGQRKKSDISLVTRKQGRCGYVPGKMFNRLMDVAYWTPVAWQITWGNRVILSSGYRRDERFEHIRLELRAIPGDSGGIILTPSGQIAGLLSVSITNTPVFFGQKYHYASAVRIIDAISLISGYLGK